MFDIKVSPNNSVIDVCRPEIIKKTSNPSCQLFKHVLHNIFEVQVSLAIRVGYVPHKSKTANTKSCILGLNKANLG